METGGERLEALPWFKLVGGDLRRWVDQALMIAEA
jgi:hypothetical protein